MWRQIRITSNSDRNLKFLKVLIRTFSDPIATHRSGVFAASLDANYFELVLFNVSTNHYPGTIISGRVINSLVSFKICVCYFYAYTIYLISVVHYVVLLSLRTDYLLATIERNNIIIYHHGWNFILLRLFLSQKAIKSNKCNEILYYRSLSRRR